MPASHYAPISRLASDVVGGKSGRNHATSRRHPIHIGRMVRNAYIRVGWYEDYSLLGTVKESYLLQLLVALYTFAGMRILGPAPGTRYPFTLAEPTASGHNRGVGSANVKPAY